MKKPPSRRQNQPKRNDTDRLWREGIFDEDSPDLQRWSYDAKIHGLKKKKSTELGEGQSGTIIEVNRKTCKIIDDQGKIQSCQLVTNLNLTEFSSLGVGDYVLFKPEDGNSGIITKIKPRINTVYRMGPEDRKFNKIILAANIDQIILVLSFKSPGFNSKQMDRFLVRINNIPARKLICINKSDLITKYPSEIEYVKKLGWEFHFMSVQQNLGIEELRVKMAGFKSVLMGPSGVGKSSLVKVLTGEALIKTGEVRESDGRGRHTTTRSNAYICAGNTWIIDTPGIREIAAWDLNHSEILDYFTEFRDPKIQECKFRNCLHINELDCGILRGVNEGIIPEFRYLSYLRIAGNSQRDLINKHEQE